jgi:hypothetical protein
MLPEGVWHHVFPTGKQLLHLQSLGVSEKPEDYPDGHLVAQEGSRLLSCCLGLQSLSMWDSRYNTELLAPLTGLSSLTELNLSTAGESTAYLDGWEPVNSQSLDVWEVVCQLTGLRHLMVATYGNAKQLLPELTQLQGLTQLDVCSTDSHHGLSWQVRFDR